MPEPSTMILVGSGLAGIAIRVIQQQYRMLKRLVDVIVATGALVVFSPCLAITMLLVKLTSRGPVFFRQDRVGKKGRIFEIIKLRTMHVNAEAQTGPTWAKPNDPRVTAVGRVLRRTHLDEVPQLFNVLKGDMSIVGPRPERAFFTKKFAREFPEYMRRHDVRPGITGLACIRCRSDQDIRDVRRKLKLDLIYVRRICWLVDFRIMVETLRFLVGRGHKRRHVASAS